MAHPPTTSRDADVPLALQRAATLALRLFALLSVVLAALAWWYMRDTPFSTAAYVFIGLPLAAALVLVALSVISPAARIGSAITVFILVLGFVAVDAYLGRPDVIAPQVAKIRRLGVDFDPRRASEVVFEARAEGKELTLPLLPFEYLFAFGSETLFSNPALSRIVLCNELGSFEYVDTDEYGFNNPRGLWNSGQMDVLMLGDSFAEGQCVPQQARLAEVIRTAYPRTINLGRGGLGPLGELALLREYGWPIAPRLILWCFFENDLDDLAAEARVPTLARYLEDRAFSQNLYGRRDEVNRRVAATVEERLALMHKRERLPFRGTRHLVNNWAPALRNAGLVLNARKTSNDLDETRGLFLKTMREADRFSRAIGAQLVFVYLRSFVGEGPDADASIKEHARARLVKSVTQELGIPTIDLAEAVRARYPDPRDMHRVTAQHPIDAPANIAGHYNAAGHRFAGEAIVQALRTRFPALTSADSARPHARNDH